MNMLQTRFYFWLSTHVVHSLRARSHQKRPTYKFANHGKLACVNIPGEAIVSGQVDNTVWQK